MTVAELIRFLEKYPKNHELWFEYQEGTEITYMKMIYISQGIDNTEVTLAFQNS